MKKIVIFGSTGMTGLCSIEAAIKKGLQVRAFLRDPAKLPNHFKDKVEAFKGDALKPESVAAAVEGTDGVVVTLGTRESFAPTTDLSESLKNILEAMKVKNVKDVTVCLSSFLFCKPHEVPELYRPVTEDHRKMYEALKENPLNWVAVFAPKIIEEPSREMKVYINPEKIPDGPITKWDLGAFMIDALFDPKYYKTVVGLVNVPKQ
ncbi:unnamed protein product [Parnassius mnemosyne]|uniref:NAD(P)-binding domain-containing protein n=1 Tax=Parnassius mnemosyne TaxID=213953 RepID=A0AAV1KNB2_9NEOP